MFVGLAALMEVSVASSHGAGLAVVVIADEEVVNTMHTCSSSNSGASSGSNTNTSGAAAAAAAASAAG